VEWRRILGWVALGGAVGELISAFFIEFPAAAIVFAVLFALAWLWLRRGGITPVVVLALLLAIELAGLPFYERSDVDDWIVQAAFFVIGVAGLVAAAAVIREHLRTRSPSA
jgi:hypothetical protein